MAHAAQDRQLATINITPLVDVLLVMLVIFMVAAPLLSRPLPMHASAARQPDYGDAASNCDCRSTAPATTRSMAGRSARARSAMRCRPPCSRRRICGCGSPAPTIAITRRSSGRCRWPNAPASATSAARCDDGAAPRGRSSAPLRRGSRRRRARSHPVRRTTPRRSVHGRSTPRARPGTVARNAARLAWLRSCPALTPSPAACARRAVSAHAASRCAASPAANASANGPVYSSTRSAPTSAACGDGGIAGIDEQAHPTTERLERGDVRPQRRAIAAEVEAVVGRELRIAVRHQRRLRRPRLRAQGVEAGIAARAAVQTDCLRG